ncbi:MAG: hypothetical protein J1F32_00950 [Erysipelotrichales bacterium]|nr:hypothetical protein [Erysipelotrichales bacterium]
MKVIFKAIGGFFVRIWRWIKETAWVQPLLIVSLIFGIILLIQPISQGITSLVDTIGKRQPLYKNNKVSLYDNDAYDLIYDEDTKFAKDDKYFLVFVQEGCDGCESAYPGFKTLFEDKTFQSDYKMKTIYIDEEGDDVDMFKEGKMYDLFFRFTDEIDNFHQAIYNAADNSEYWDETFDQESEQRNMLYDIYIGEDISTPLILLMDKETYEEDPSTFGIKEVMIGVRGWDGGTDKYDLAETLDRMWLSSWGSDYKLGK